MDYFGTRREVPSSRCQSRSSERPVGRLSILSCYESAANICSNLFRYLFRMEVNEEVMESVEEEESDDTTGEIEEFDRNLPSEHAYLPGGLVTIRGRSVLEAGWEGRIPCWCHHSVVFPGESVPMHCPDLTLNRLGMQFVHAGRLFGLICPDDDHTMSDYGVLCEVIEATEPSENEEDLVRQISLKAQARQRFRLRNSRKWLPNLKPNMFLNGCDIKILPDIVLHDPLRGSRIFSALQNDKSPSSLSLRRADSLVTPWPHFVYDKFDVEKIVESIKLYFKELSLENLPDDLLSLSFWVASNLTIPLKDRLELFKVDNALLRLYMELKYLHKNRILCTACISQSHYTPICKVKEIFAMSNEGPHSNYCNIGGYVHGVVTVQNVTNVVLQGRPSMEFTWFPGYYWTIAICSVCSSHLGWKFSAAKKSLRPQLFWGLSRNSISARIPTQTQEE